MNPNAFHSLVLIVLQGFGAIVTPKERLVRDEMLVVLNRCKGLLGKIREKRPADELLELATNNRAYRTLVYKVTLIEEILSADPGASVSLAKIGEELLDRFGHAFDPKEFRGVCDKIMENLH